MSEADIERFRCEQGEVTDRVLRDFRTFFPIISACCPLVEGAQNHLNAISTLPIVELNCRGDGKARDFETEEMSQKDVENLEAALRLKGVCVLTMDDTVIGVCEGIEGREDCQNCPLLEKTSGWGRWLFRRNVDGSANTERPRWKSYF